jgi:hypothetical protein
MKPDLLAGARLSVAPAHGRRLTAFFAWDDGLAPWRRAVLKNMAVGARKWEQAITHRIGAEEAPALCEGVSRGPEPDVLGGGHPLAGLSLRGGGP